MGDCIYSMKILVLGAGMMGRAIAFDLQAHSDFDKITIADKSRSTIKSAEDFLKNKKISFDKIDVENTDEVRKKFECYDVVISAIPYYYNYELTKIAIQTKTHFLDLGGNNTIVNKQRSLDKQAKENNVTVIPDCGLAPGLVSVVVKDIVESFNSVDSVKIRVGGLPQNPKPPLNYQLVFSPNGLINEYVEDTIVLDSGKIVTRKSMTDIEKISFPKPFTDLEAFNTSGGCSTLPYTYKKEINYLDYKTIRYPGHCNNFKPLLDLGLGDEKPVLIENQKIKPRDLLIEMLQKQLPSNEEDVVLMKVFGSGTRDNTKSNVDYTMIDYYDEENNITSMMRTTAYPVSIIAQLIQRDIIDSPGVFCSEEIIPCKEFFDELEKRNIIIDKKLG